MTADVTVNGRFGTQRLSGVQRVAAALVQRLATPVEVLVPPKSMPRVLGHPWEQLVLPVLAGGRVLWSPCNTGPIGARRHVVTLHDAAVLDHPEWFSARFARLYAELWPRLARRARLVTVSEFSRRRLSARLGVPEADIAVAPNGVDACFQPASPAAIRAVRDRLGLDEAPYFLTLSTLEPRKNLALVLRAWRRAGLKDALLVVAGASGRRAVFAGAGDPGLAAPGVVPVGHVPDAELPALISGARALIYPSLYEGFGLPVLEAMACGVAAVTTRCGSLPEVGGDAALYVDPQDDAELAELMVALVETPALSRDHGAAGLARAAQFSWEAAARSMDQILAQA